jgi:hypothetical protein
LNNNKEKIYCDESGNIFNSLNNSLQDSLYAHPIIILITLFCILKITELCDELHRMLRHMTQMSEKGNDK